MPLLKPAFVPYVAARIIPIIVNCDDAETNSKYSAYMESQHVKYAQMLVAELV
jgi:uncharacterized lipoprotein YehR (DUF1307 family)